MIEIEELKNEVKQALSEKKYYHCICVAKECVKLAKTYNVDELKAELIGIGHDIAKELTEEQKIKYIKDNNIIIDEIEERNLGLLHAKIGADICRKRFGFTDDMVQAVLYHTTGAKRMDDLAKILYIADGCGEDREWEDALYVRELAEKDLDEAMLYLLDVEIGEEIKKKKQMHLNSILARNELLSRL